MLKPAARPAGAVDASPSSWFSPIVRAVLTGNISTVRKVLQDGADVNETDNATGQTALHAAAEILNPEIVLFLLRVGAVRTTNRNGETPAELCHWSSGDVKTKQSVLKMLGGLPSYFVTGTKREGASCEQLVREYIERNGHV
jgi:hypothetical protein